MRIHEKHKVHAHAVEVLERHLEFVLGDNMAASFMSRSPIVVSIAKKSGLMFDAIQSRDFNTDRTVGEWVGDLFHEFMHCPESVA